MPRRQQGPRRVGLVLTGGTIGSGVSSSNSGERVVRLVDGGDGGESPELAIVRQAADRVGEFEFSIRQPIRLSSENFTPKDWIAVATAIRDLVTDDGADGVLVLHGTDTMAYTSAAMSFMLSGLAIPVVLTGANKPSDQLGSDAVENIQDSLVALHELGPGVFVVFAGRPTSTGRVHLGTRVRKVRASGNAFESVGRRPVAEVRDGRFTRFWTPAAPKPVCPHLEVDRRVLSFKLYPGLDMQAMLEAITAAKSRGVVLELFPSFTGPSGRSRFSVPRFADACMARGIPVVAAVANEPTGKSNLYESRITLEAAGAEILHMLPETATVKMMWALGASRKRDSVIELMRTPIANELYSS